MKSKKNLIRLGVPGMKPGHVPLERALSKLGIATRTQARALILAGKVRVNGVIKKVPVMGVVPEKIRVEIEGEADSKTDAKTFLLHKPRGIITTHADEKGRPNVFQLLEKENLHLIAVGRLDFATSGLLLLTNDTKLAAYLTDPSNSVKRTYVVSVRGKIEEADLRKICEGIQDDGDLLRADDVILRKSSAKESHLTIELSEGKNREIRRIFESLGSEVTKLKRIAYGRLELGNLAPGDYRRITIEELKKCFPHAPVREDLAL